MGLGHMENAQEYEIISLDKENTHPVYLDS